jgi:hypothetical protein
VTPFRIILIKPSKYGLDGAVERFRRGFMPNSTLLHLRSLTPDCVAGRQTEVRMIDEYTFPNLRYLDLLRPASCDLLAIAGAQSHQMHRALDLCALARRNGVRSIVIGGPHPMTCDTSEAQGRGVSFALAEAELIWPSILEDAAGAGELKAVYGAAQRWMGKLDPPAAIAPERELLRSYVIPMVGVYPARGCPYNCSFCSVVKIAGRVVRGQPVDTTIRTLVNAKRAGVRLVMFTSDNFNKYGEARQLLHAMIDEGIRLPFFVQCDLQLERDEDLVALLARAGCAQVFVGAESFSRAALKSVRKHQNDPSAYGRLIALCHRHGVSTHFSNILGFPNQDERDIHEHLGELRSMNPFMASFYVLTPIPGTDQYEEFRAEGLITESNLDRFDATRAVWKHPRISQERLNSLLAHCYRQFYSAGDVVRKLILHRWNATCFVHLLGLIYPAYTRFAVNAGMHPMAGGFGRRVLDRAGDYRQLREQVYGLRQLSLPAGLAIPAPDRQITQLM